MLGLAGVSLYNPPGSNLPNPTHEIEVSLPISIGSLLIVQFKMVFAPLVYLHKWDWFPIAPKTKHFHECSQLSALEIKPGSN